MLDDYHVATYASIANNGMQTIALSVNVLQGQLESRCAEQDIAIDAGSQLLAIIANGVDIVVPLCSRTAASLNYDECRGDAESRQDL